MKRVILAVVFALTVTAVVGCGGGSSTSKPTPPPTKS